MDICLKQEKFHTVVFRKYFVKRIIKEDQTIRNFLCYYHELACEKYNTEAKHDALLGGLYSSSFTVSLLTYGIYSVIEYSFVAIDPKYIDDKNYNMYLLENAFSDLIVPYFEGNKASSELFDRAYEIYESDLLADQENHQRIAVSKALEYYFKDTNRDFKRNGCLEDLKKIKPEDVFNYHQEVKKEESLSISSGNFEPKINVDSITLKSKSNFYFKQRNQVKPFYHEHAKTSQAYLFLIYETATYANDDDFYAMQYLNYIIGGQASSRLFKYVREKYGLCYSISSMYLGASGIIVISAIINLTDLEDTVKVIEEALKSIFVEDFNFDLVKNHFISSHNAGNDYMATAIVNYLSDNYFLDTPKSYKEIEMLTKVTKEDIFRVYDKLARTLIYVYGGDGNE